MVRIARLHRCYRPCTSELHDLCYPLENRNPSKKVQIPPLGHTKNPINLKTQNHYLCWWIRLVKLGTHDLPSTWYYRTYWRNSCSSRHSNYWCLFGQWKKTLEELKHSFLKQSQNNDRYLGTNDQRLCQLLFKTYKGLKKEINHLCNNCDCCQSFDVQDLPLLL